MRYSGPRSLPRVNITGIVVYTRPERSGAVRDALAAIAGVEVHAISPEGRMVVTVATCPPLSEDDLPSAEWFRWRAIGLRAEASAWRERAAWYRLRAEWEDDRAERLGHHAREFDAEADRLFAEACRCEWSAGNSWSRPRRVVLAAGR